MNRPPGPHTLGDRRRTARRIISRRRRRLLFSVLILLAILVIAILAAMGRDGSRREGEAYIRVLPGAGATEIARLLKDEDVIDSEKAFKKKAEESGVADDLKPGLYKFQRGELIESILTKLKEGIQSPEGQLVVPEGYRIEDIARELSAKTDIGEEQYVSKAVPIGRRLPVGGAADAQSLEGMLFPRIYDLEPGLTADALIDQQLVAFERETAGLPWQDAEAMGLTPYEILTVASLVEREARVPEERPMVAAVIYNRLRLGMKLEIDATVQYAVGYWKRDLTQDDLETDSPYNTRLYAGLPPAPICNPGLDAIRSALEPADVDYLYYVATGDEEGHHFFTASYDEFLVAKGQR